MQETARVEKAQHWVAGRRGGTLARRLVRHGLVGGHRRQSTAARHGMGSSVRKVARHGLGRASEDNGEEEEGSSSQAAQACRRLGGGGARHGVKVGTTVGTEKGGARPKVSDVPGSGETQMADGESATGVEQARRTADESPLVGDGGELGGAASARWRGAPIVESHRRSRIGLVGTAPMMPDSRRRGGDQAWGLSSEAGSGVKEGEGGVAGFGTVGAWVDGSIPEREGAGVGPIGRWRKRGGGFACRWWACEGRGPAVVVGHRWSRNRPWGRLMALGLDGGGLARERWASDGGFGRW